MSYNVNKPPMPPPYPPPLSPGAPLITPLAGSIEQKIERLNALLDQSIENLERMNIRDRATRALWDAVNDLVKKEEDAGDHDDRD